MWSSDLAKAYRPEGFFNFPFLCSKHLFHVQTQQVDGDHSEVPRGLLCQQWKWAWKWSLSSKTLLLSTCTMLERVVWRGCGVWRWLWHHLPALFQSLLKIFPQHSHLKHLANFHYKLVSDPKIVYSSWKPRLNSVVFKTFQVLYMKRPRSAALK